MSKITNKADLGKVAITVASAPWNANTKYEKLTQVFLDGDSYVSLKDNKNINPSTDTTGTWAKSTAHGKSLYELLNEKGLYDGTEDEFLAEWNKRAEDTDKNLKDFDVLNKEFKKTETIVKNTVDNANTAIHEAGEATNFANSAAADAEAATARANTAAANAEGIKTSLDNFIAQGGGATDAQVIKNTEDIATLGTNISELEGKFKEVVENDLPIEEVAKDGISKPDGTIVTPVRWRNFIDVSGVNKIRVTQKGVVLSAGFGGYLIATYPTLADAKNNTNVIHGITDTELGVGHVTDYEVAISAEEKYVMVLTNSSVGINVPIVKGYAESEVEFAHKEDVDKLSNEIKNVSGVAETNATRIEELRELINGDGNEPLIVDVNAIGQGRKQENVVIYETTDNTKKIAVKSLEGWSYPEGAEKPQWLVHCYDAGGTIVLNTKYQLGQDVVIEMQDNYASIKVVYYLSVSGTSVVDGIYKAKFEVKVGEDSKNPSINERLTKAEVDIKELQDKPLKVNLGIDGDSITMGNRWSYQLYLMLGALSHHNVAYGGGRYAKASVSFEGVNYIPQNYTDTNFAGFESGSTTNPPSAESAQKIANNCAPVHIQKFIKEVEDGTYPTPNVFCFSFGTNDDLPTDEQVQEALDCTDYPTEEMQYNMAGGLRYVLQKIHETYPYCKIYVCLPIQRSWKKYKETTWETKSKSKMQKRCEIIRKIAEDFSVEVIDMWAKSGIVGALEAASGGGPYLQDGLHPNKTGEELMGKCAANYIRCTY